MKMLSFIMGLLLLGNGCVGLSDSIRQRGRVVSVLQTTVGLKIEPSISSGTYPGIQFGLIRTETVILLDGTNDLPSVSFETDIRNGRGIFQEGSARRKVSAGDCASGLPPLFNKTKLNLQPELPLSPEPIR